MRLLHSLAKTHASFDDPNLVSHAGLVPVMALAQRAGLGELVAEHVTPGGECGVNAHLKVPCLVAGMGRCRSDDAGRGSSAPWSSSLLSDLRITRRITFVHGRPPPTSGPGWALVTGL